MSLRGEVVRCGAAFLPNAQGQSAPSPFGGTYTPGHMKNGVFVSACWRGTMFLERGSRKGQTIHLTVWNGQNSPAGLGSADRFAKEIAPGTVLVIDADLDIFKRQLKDPVSGAAMAFSNGQLIEQTLTGFKYVPRSMYVIKHSAKHLAACYSRPLNVADFWSITPYIPGTADYDAKQQQMAEVYKARRAMPFAPGATHYGYATVKALPADYQLMNNPPAGYVRPTTTGTATVTTAGVAGATGIPSIPVAGAPATVAMGSPAVATAPYGYDPATGQPLTAPATPAPVTATAGATAVPAPPLV